MRAIKKETWHQFLLLLAIHIYRKSICATGAALNIAYARNITKRATLANNYKSCIGI